MAPAFLLPLLDLPFFTGKHDDLYNNVCVTSLRVYRTVGGVVVRKLGEGLGAFAKFLRRRISVDVVVALAALMIAIIGLRYAASDTFFKTDVLSIWIMTSTSSTGVIGKTQVHACVVHGLSLAIAAASLVAVSYIGWRSPGGSAWGLSRMYSIRKKLHTPHGPRGWPLLGSWASLQGSNMHRELAKQAWNGGPILRELMAFSVGTTRIVLTSDPKIAKEILRSAAFAERPLKQAAAELKFDRAIGFAVQGHYWRQLRQIAASRLFSQKQIATNYESLQQETSRMLLSIARTACSVSGNPADEPRTPVLCMKPYLQRAAVNNMMAIVFGRHFEFQSSCPQAEALEAMIRDGFELLGAFNWADHLPLLRHLPFLSFSRRCRQLTKRVKEFVKPMIDEHRHKHMNLEMIDLREPSHLIGNFVDVLLSLEGDQKLADADMISVLWEMLFRGTDTIAVLTEWALAEVILNPEIQSRIHKEIDTVVGSDRIVQHNDIDRLPYLQAVVKETLRCHPPGPLLSWARLATEDTQVAGYDIPQGTTAMVNMWAITHDPSVWSGPHIFNPSRFLEVEGGVDFDVRGNDLRLAPFGSGRRVCPGRALGIATAQLWLARLLHHFSWSQAPHHKIVLTDNLKLSCEMASPLRCCPILRVPI